MGLVMIFHYGVFGFFRLLKDKLFTYFIFPQAKIIRQPFECRGKRSISLASGLSTGRYCRIEAHDVNKTCSTLLTIGRNCQINDSVHIAAAESITLGDNVLIASRVFISDLNHGSYSGSYHSEPDSLCSERELSTNPVVIHDNVWLGEGVVVLPGVVIGKNSIVGANSVVTKSIPEHAIVAGNPARIIKKYCFSLKEWVVYAPS
jgi:acetyltransferase-like isoleucine patch superfamily enzyme